MPKVLIADDQPGIRFFLTEVFRDLYDIVVVEDGKLALDEYNKQSFDLLLTDMKMPNLDGLGLIKEIRKTDQDIKIIVMTAYSNSSTFSELMNLNIFGNVAKPFDISEVMELVENALTETNKN